MRRQKGVFAVTVPLARGAHQYKFIVDGQWITDPENSSRAANGLGSMNSVVVV
jgi:1,4-alpha-glucan branching enzyme